LKKIASTTVSQRKSELAIVEEKTLQLSRHEEGRYLN